MYANRAYSDLDVTATGAPPALAAYSDLDTSVDAVKHDRERHLLILAIKHLALLSDEKLSLTALLAAIEFVTNLPTNRALPKVAADEDGDVFMAWDAAPQRCTLTFEGKTLHLVINPGSKSVHVDPTIYQGGHIPPVVLQHMPRRKD